MIIINHGMKYKMKNSIILEILSLMKNNVNKMMFYTAAAKSKIINLALVLN